MLKEHHYDGTFFWPDNIRTAVVMTFDFQGGEDVRPLPDGTMDHEEWTQCEYGPHTAIWRILRMLEEENVKATFNTCGGIAERYPEAVKAIVTKGHEIAGHGYHHECARDLTREQEWDVMKRTTDMIRNRTGHTPIGWRSCTQSPNSIELLMEHGYLWNSNSFSHDLPFLWEKNGRYLVELPRQPFGDGRTYQHRNNDSGNPADTLIVWKGMFDDFYEESKFGGTYVPFQFHPYISGRPGRAATLRAIIRHMKKEGVWFATAGEVARWTYDRVFKIGSAEAAPRKVATA
ncbi:MAG TPA: polysaccharide deacetylase family protein [Xanthobacteraceae bacterium]|nr:polysaccharide deacetylase family protein [Xanthobacteraceae bacterium]